MTDPRGLPSHLVETEVRFAKVEARLESAEKRFAEIDERLKVGARTFTELQAALRPSLLRVIGVVAGGALVFAGLIWRLSRYPDAEEFQTFKEQSAATAQALSSKIQEQSADVRETRGAVQRLEERAGKLEEKLDAALAGPRRRPR